MFQKLAKFRLVRSLGLVPGRRAAMPANDNLPGGLRPRRAPSRAPRSKSRPLICRWSLIDGSTQLVCRWQSEEDPDRQATMLRGRTGVSYIRLGSVLSGTAIA
jgi:hypothetical protein